MQFKTINAFIERARDGAFSVYVDLDDNTLNYGIHGQGKTAKETIDDFVSAYETMKGFHQKEIKPFIEASFEYLYV